jgi:3-dehydroquinate synthase
MFELTVKHAGGAYRVYGERGALSRAGGFIRAALPDARRAFLVTDEHVKPLWLKPLAQATAEAGFEVAWGAIPGGEESKDALHLEGLYQAFAAARVTRADVVVALGGGSLSDVAGFAAATFKRGIPWAVVPTTLLAQLDACVGGKVGVDFAGLKNQIGAFYQPAAVVVDGGLLATLPAKHISAGLAEAVKYGLLAGPSLFDFLETNAAALVHAGEELDAVVERGLTYKTAVVSADERDYGQRHLLNLGHTFGHAFESVSRFTLHHGEAVAVGLLYTCLLAELRGVMATEDVIRVATLLRQFGLPTHLPSLRLPGIMEALAADKKLEGDDIYMAIPRAPGNVVVEPIAFESVVALLPQIHHLARSMA